MLIQSFRLLSYLVGIEDKAARAVAAGLTSSQSGRRRGRSVAPVEMLETRTMLSGLTIIPTFASNITSDPKAAQIKAAINAGISQIESDFSDPITVKIKFQEGGGLGGSSTYFDTVSYSAYRAALVSHATSSNDASAIASLPTGSINPVNGSTKITLTDPDARALGLGTGTGPLGFDSTITLNTGSCNLTRTSINPSKYDLQAVAMHEIDEVLGSGSILTGVKNGAAPPSGAVEPEDLFRYTSGGTRSYSTSATAGAFFSINGGTTDLDQFNQNQGGDYSDWKTGSSAQVQDAFGSTGVIPYYNVEPTELDVVGFTPTRNFGTGIVTGVVFNDANGNGVQDSGESNLSGWTIEAVQGGKVITSAQSNALGYQLTSLPDGTYTIQEVPQTGYAQTTPASSYSVTITGHNDTVSGKNFGNDPNLDIAMSSSLNTITLRVYPSNHNDLEILKGGSLYKTVAFSSFSDVIISGAALTINSVTVDYSDGFFSAGVAFTGGTGLGAKNSLSVIDDGTSGTRQWTVNPVSIVAIDTGETEDPSVTFVGVQSVSLAGRSSGSETILVKNFGASLPTTTITIHINSSDTVNVQGTGTPLVIDGTGNTTGEAVNIESFAPSLGGTLANINGPVTVNNISSLTADDSGDTTARTSTISTTSLKGFGLPGSSVITYSSLASVNVHGGSNDNMTVTGTSATTNLYPGSDSNINVLATSSPLNVTGTSVLSQEDVTVGSLAPSLGGTLANISGAVTVTNISTLTADDSGDSINRTGTISATALTGFGLPGSSAINYGSQLSTLTVHGGKGSNTDIVTGTGVNTSTELFPSAGAASTVNVKANAGSLTINGNGLADIVNIGSLAPGIDGVLTKITGSITLTNTLNTSTLSLDDSGDATGRTGTISTNAVSGFGMGSGVDVNYTASQIASLTVRGGQGLNTENVTGTAAPTTLFAGTLDHTTINVKATTALLTINGNDLVNNINIGSLAPSLGGTLAKIAGPIVVTNTSASSTLSLDDSGDATGRTGTISSTAVTGFGMGVSASVKYTGSGLGALTVRGGTGTNTETITGTSTPTTLYAGAGNACNVNVLATTAALTINGNATADTIDIGSLAPSLGGTLTQILGSITVTNTSNQSTLTLDDSGDNTSRTGTLSPTLITGLGMGAGVSVSYTGSQLASLTLHGGKAGGTLHESGTSTSTTVTGLTVIT